MSRIRTFFETNLVSEWLKSFELSKILYQGLYKHNSSKQNFEKLFGSLAILSLIAQKVSETLKIYGF